MEKLIKRDDGMIQTLRADGKKGEFLLRSQYETWTLFILSTLDIEEGLTLNDLLGKARQKVPGLKDNEIGWNILQVKRDLEARGFIKVTPAPSTKRILLIKLTRLGRNKIKHENQLAEWSEINP